MIYIFVWFVFTFRPALFLVLCFLCVLFSLLHLSPFVFERQIYFGRWIRKNSRLSPLFRKKTTPDSFAVPNIFCRPKPFSIPPSILLCAVKKAHKLRWGMKKKSVERKGHPGFFSGKKVVKSS